MEFSEKILRGRYFPAGSRDKLKAKLVNLLLLLAIMIMIVDVYGSIKHHYYAMSLIEGTSAAIFLITYILFFHIISLKNTIYIVLAVISFLFVISLTIPGDNPALALFWLATLPIHIFFFLGVESGIRWTIVIILTLVLTTLNSLFEWLTPLYNIELLSQITLGYMAISYLLFVLEKERQGYEISLVSALKDKEILLKEVHHRTKNNMQIMIGLLDTQSFKIDDMKYKKMFQSHVDRLKAMALVHEHLYVGETYETVEIDTYLKEITKNLQNVTRHTIITDIDPLVLDMKIAMNLGLVFNEAVVNAIEHAYEENENGEIEVSLKRIGKKCVLRVKDHGKGFDMQKMYNTLGVTLMKDISTSLDDEKIEIDVKDGTEIRIYCTLQESV
jgi:two-component sensor histidine kinase